MRNIKKEINIFQGDLPDNLVLNGDLAIDTETMGLDIRRDALCLVQICDEDGEIYLIQMDNKNKTSDGLLVAPNLTKYLNDEHRTKIFHFARFDIAVLKKNLGLKKINNIFCTKIVSKLTRTYTEYHGLKTIVNELLNVELKKEQQSSNWSSVMLSNAQKLYAANDVRYLHELKTKLEEMLLFQNKTQMADDLFNCLNVICDADIMGFIAEALFQH